MTTGEHSSSHLSRRKSVASVSTTGSSSFVMRSNALKSLSKSHSKHKFSSNCGVKPITFVAAGEPAYQSDMTLTQPTPDPS